jgi:ketosteroid isomerase-like protein
MFRFLRVLNVRWRTLIASIQNRCWGADLVRISVLRSLQDLAKTFELSVPGVQALVETFWKSFLQRDTKALRDFYSPQALVFGSHSERSEGGITVATRRAIEFFGEHMALQNQIGPISIQLIRPEAAVASYIFSFSAVETRQDGQPGGTYEEIQLGRATQVFALDRAGDPKIVHEHFSIIPPSKNRGSSLV